MSADSKPWIQVTMCQEAVSAADMICAEQFDLYLGDQQVAQHSWWVCGVLLLPHFR
jgi:hypothetical protein